MRIIILSFLIACVALSTAWANDGVFFVNGNQLVPVQETDIALTKEVLTISLCDDGYATVDVQCTEIALRNGTGEWHAKNFRPKSNMNIQSAERLHYDNFIRGTFYDRSDRYMPGSYMIEPDKSAARNHRLHPSRMETD